MTQLDHRSLPEALQPMEPEPGFDRQRLAIGLLGILLGIAFGLVFWLSAEAIRLLDRLDAAYGITEAVGTEQPVAP